MLFEVDYRRSKTVIFKMYKMFMIISSGLRSNYMSQLSLTALNHDLEILISK